MMESTETNFFRKIRKEKNLSLKQIAEIADIKYQQYQKFESGERELENASFVTACKILEALDIDIVDYYHRVKNK